MKKILICILITFSFASCGFMINVPTASVHTNLRNYTYVYVIPTAPVTSSSGVYGNVYGVYGGSTKTVTPSETINGYFMKKGYTEEEACRYITDSVKIAVRARDRFWADEKNRAGRPRPLIAGSVGPYGAYLADGSEYRGDYKIAEADLAAFHRSRIRLLVEAGVDFLACETIPCLWEAQVIAKVVGGLLPLAAKALKLDPAVMASPFITTIVDAVSLLIYFVVAKALLKI